MPASALWQHAAPGTAAKDDPNPPPLAVETATVTVFGKSWDFHVTRLGTNSTENLAMIRDTFLS